MSAWQSLTLGGIFPGSAATIADLQAEADDLLNKYSAVVGQMNAKVAALDGIIGTTLGLASAMGAAGFYMLPLEPGAGGWQTRINAAAGAPPNNGASAGMVIVVQGPDVLAIADQYAKLSSILTSPISVPR
jgi:hypothetical protein